MRSSNPKLSQLIQEYIAIYDGQPWYGDSLCKIVKRVTPAVAFWQPSQGAHSIAQMISHIIYWRQVLIKRLRGDFDFHPYIGSEDNWKSNDDLRRIGWKSLKISLNESQHQLLSLLAQQKDLLLRKKYSDKFTFEDIINGILQHDLYHIGQIAFLKKLYQYKNK